MILCLAQISPCWNDPFGTIEKIRRYTAEAAQNDASLIVFPEQILTGWNPGDITRVTNEDGEEISTLREIARELQIGILGSYREETKGKPFNTSIVIGHDGNILARYHKIHLFSPAGEDQYFEQGSSMAVFSLHSCIIGLGICYDLRFAPLFQAYRDAGVHLMLIPSAWPASRMNLFHLFTTSRAAEYQMFVASVNTTGNSPVDTYTGGSCIAGPDGTVRVMATEKEELIFYDIQPSEAECLRQTFPVYKDFKKEIM